MDKVIKGDSDILVLTTTQFSEADKVVAEVVVRDQTESIGEVFFRLKTDPNEVVNGFNDVINGQKENMAVAVMEDFSTKVGFDLITLGEAYEVLMEARLLASVSFQGQ